MKRILIIDDDMDMCSLLARFLQRKGFETDVAYNGNKGIEKFKENSFDLVLCDFRLGDKEGRAVLKEIKAMDSHAIVIIITGYSDIKMAVEVIKYGAYDYITKPLVPEEILNLIKNALQQPSIEDSRSMQPGVRPVTFKKTSYPANKEYITGESPATKELYRQVELIAPTNYSVIIYGESGTGKEVIAKAIHEGSSRKDKPFVALDCGTISKELAGSELFGHMKGSFTGAQSDKEGLFETAYGGTLFLDEIANLSPDIQAGLLRVIQERKFKRVGGTKEIEADVRVIVASNENLQEAYRKGKFREDLYHRFNEFSVNIPSLRDRREDIPLFASFFLQKACDELNKELDGFEDEVMQMFINYSWPGNLREFKNVVRRATLLTASGLINSNVLPWEMLTTPATEPENAPPVQSNSRIPGAADTNLKSAASHAEYETIMNVLKQVRFNKTRAADILQIDRKTLYNKLRAYEELQQQAQ